MSKKQAGKKNRSQPGGLLVMLAAVAILVAAVVLVALLSGLGNGSDDPTNPPATNPVKIENTEKVNINLGYGLYIKDVGKYTGAFVEDGTNDVISGVLMIVVENTGETDIQYAEIELPVGEKTGHFVLSTLPAGKSMVLLETSRMQYEQQGYHTAVCQNVVLFQEALNLHQDKIKIQARDGILNITNISNQNIEGRIVIYYKNASSDMLYGGITYRATIEGGLKSGEVRQLAVSHFTVTGSQIMFVTCG